MGDKPVTCEIDAGAEAFADLPWKSLAFPWKLWNRWENFSVCLTGQQLRNKLSQLLLGLSLITFVLCPPQFGTFGDWLAPTVGAMP